ncbi:transporter substrate-binding domain-containing protein [Pseudomonas stutzeri]|uniref:Bifunctional lytic transglycosylase/amino acid ABC transporter substrate-binding protein n=1 Tax=Stutzerimonas stutzeri TaxID=316 RepID=A0A2N8S4I5_STUST|nr:transporter substrate-binding domain-containing protein [Stutzerimonas stutzeri]MCQ4294061.1 transporter substrate-binding domain-containing protein [Stutzerimonas stutzeri]PNF81543.1 bifunctional lytic transglycosylase/amino acid ABC transporter substrate-binding protein [Stutzerimonas stutzeri]
MAHGQAGIACASLLEQRKAANDPLKALLYLALATLLGAPAEAMAEAAPQRILNVGYYEFAPAIYTDAQGTARGDLAELTRRVARQAGYDVHFRGLPGARLYAALENGSIDLWPGAQGKPELAAHTLEGRHTLSQINLNLYHRTGTPAPRIPQDLAGKSLILIGGYSYWPNVNALLDDPELGLRLLRTSNHLSALEMLRRERGDYLLDYQIPVEQARQRLQMEELPYLRLTQIPIHFIVSRHARDAEAVVAALDEAYEALRAAGEDISLPSD